ncbi:MAG: hypothetical protein ACO25B_06180 [Chitinophagaceae bacterium]
MEVHHHAHTPRKKWTHYFWEFLMLFLAVFCGFLAEYQLEHKIEKERGRQYIRSFYGDLKSDTAEFSGMIEDNEKKLTVLGKRNDCFDSMPAQIRSYNPCINELMIYASAFQDLVQADQTLLQLKNSGGFRLLKKADVDSILGYDKMIRNYIKSETTGLQDIQYRVRETIQSLISYKNIRLEKEDPDVPLLNGDMKSVDHFFVLLNEYYRATRSMNRQLKLIRDKATGLILYFKNKYDLK